MKDIDNYYMEIALKEAKKAFKRKEVPVGAVIVKNDKIIAKGYNTRELKADITKHAELVVLQKACRKLKDWRLNDCTLYVTLFPCSMCASAIIQSRISRLVIGAPTKDLKNKKIVDMIFEVDSKKILLQIRSGVLENDCSIILQSFFKEQRKFVKIK